MQAPWSNAPFWNKDDDDGNTLNAFILATGGAHTQVLLKPVSTTTNEKLLLTDIFPNGAVSLRVMNMPFTLTKCSTDWRLYISSDKAPAPRNMAIWTLFGREWFGNILVMKYCANDPTTLESVDAKDQELALHILASYVQKPFSRCPTVFNNIPRWFYEFSRMREHQPQYKIAGWFHSTLLNQFL